MVRLAIESSISSGGRGVIPKSQQLCTLSVVLFSMMHELRAADVPHSSSKPVPYVKKRILLLGARLLQVADLSDSP